MTVATFFTQSVTLYRTAAISRDAIGEAFVDTEVSTPVMAYLEPVSGDEDGATRETLVGQWYAYLPAGTDVSGWDRLTYGSHEFSIVAPAEPFQHPTSSTLDHIRLRLREIS